jgi:hypothetical protein
MTFPLVELKFSQIRREAEPRVTALVRIYRVDDGGIVNGQQQYVRTLRWQRVVKVLSTADDATLLARARERFLAWLDDAGITLPPERVLCSL